MKFAEPHNGSKSIMCSTVLFEKNPKNSEQSAAYIERNNKRLLSAVKQSKTKYERWGKIIAHYEKLKTKCTE